jgi:hypothetical protein
VESTDRPALSRPDRCDAFSVRRGAYQERDWMLKFVGILTDVLNTAGILERRSPLDGVERTTEKARTMTTMLMEVLDTGDVLELVRGGDVVTVLVLLATEDSVVLDPCDGSTPFVVRAEELVEYRKFDPEAVLDDELMLV